MAKAQAYVLPDGYAKHDLALVTDKLYMKDETVWTLDGKTMLNQSPVDKALGVLPSTPQPLTGANPPVVPAPALAHPPIIDPTTGQMHANVTDHSAKDARIAELEAENAALKGHVRGQNEGQKTPEAVRTHTQMAGKYPHNTADMPTLDEVNASAKS